MTTPDFTSDASKKRCSKCGSEFPATAEYFVRNKNSRDGLSYWCKECHKKNTRKWYAENSDKARDYRQQYARTHKEQIREHSQLPNVKEQKRASQRRLYSEKPEHFRQKRRDYYRKNAESQKAKRRAYYLKHPDDENSKSREYYARNLEAQRERRKHYYYANLEAGREAGRNYYRRNAEYQRNRARLYRKSPDARVKELAREHRRRARVRDLPNNFTGDDWQRAVEYFHGCCAVCGRQANDLFGTHTLAADHWIALTDVRENNPGTVPWNIVPLCHGEGGCNNEKNNRNATEWLTRKLGKRKAKAKLAEIEAYFQWAKQRKVIS